MAHNRFSSHEAEVRAFFDRKPEATRVFEVMRRFVVKKRKIPPCYAEPVVIEAFERAWISRARYRGRGTVAAWIWGILRKVPHELPNKYLQLSDDVVCLHVEPTSSALDEDSYRQVQEAFESIPPEEYEAFFLHDVEDLTDAEVGELLGIPPSTARDRRLRAAKRLREAIAVEA